MKKAVIAMAVLSIAMAAQAQQPADTGKIRRIDQEMNADNHGLDYNPEIGFWPHIETWQPDFKAWRSNRNNQPEKIPVRPAVTMSSIVNVYTRPMPQRVVVLDNNTLRAFRHINVSNGQASNWGDFPNSFLDAQTLSFPAPRP